MARFALSNRTLSGHLENPRSWVAWMELQNLNQQTASSRLHYANGNVTRRLHVLNRFSGVHRFNPALATDGPGVDDAAATDSNATTRFINLNASSFANTGSASGTSSTSASSNNAASTNTASTIAGSTTAGSTTAGSSTNAGSNDTASDQTTSASAGSTNSGSDI
ncbi:hypothetical protein N7468_005253 [Penicillium chermesinum]|uniref:Uncharacterized protein n=1 Tax=Penicillium chermesinum TaxID=63820 RepID=A0A9W9TN15_9EURO|nr:uncharacterized protein N7468_005253 [Penicillium chermesinum]KAJ5232297.1 hypothetical protein N7468_005253 [Penicillium chermesinum]KAJ6171951.1 hypothetical protein N7470_001018 [Penicillium chermesinum]